MKVTEFDGEEEVGSRVPLKVADSKLSSAEEVDTHSLTHLLYRSWCLHVVRGKGETVDHRKASREKMMSELHVDHCIMGCKGDATTRCSLWSKIARANAS